MSLVGTIVQRKRIYRTKPALSTPNVDWDTHLTISLLYITPVSPLQSLPAQSLSAIRPGYGLRPLRNFGKTCGNLQGKNQTERERYFGAFC